MNDRLSAVSRAPRVSDSANASRRVETMRERDTSCPTWRREK